jgi:hypothetical protein
MVIWLWDSDSAGTVHLRMAPSRNPPIDSALSVLCHPLVNLHSCVKLSRLLTKQGPVLSGRLDYLPSFSRARRGISDFTIHHISSALEIALIPRHHRAFNHFPSPLYNLCWLFTVVMRRWRGTGAASGIPYMLWWAKSFDRGHLPHPRASLFIRGCLPDITIQFNAIQSDCLEYSEWV